MADNPFDQFDQKPANPFDQFDSKSAAAVPQPAVADPGAYQPPSWLPGAGILHKASNVFDDAFTMGGADTATGKAGDLLRTLGIRNATPDTDALRAQTAQDRQDIGPIGSTAADMAGYAVGPGAAGAGEALAAKLGGGIFGRVAGSAAEGAGSAALGTVGHGDTDLSDVGKSAGVGGVLGALTGAVPTKASPVPGAKSTADLLQESKAAWDPVEKALVNPSDVSSAVNNASLALTPGERASMGSSLSGKVNDVTRAAAGANKLTADDVAKFQQSLLKSARGDADKRIASQYVTALDGSLGPAKPLVDNANQATNIYKTSRDIDNWAADPSSAPAKVAGALAKKPAFYQAQPGLFDSLSAIAAQAKPPSLGRQLGAYALKAGAGAGIGAGANYALGGNPGSGLVEGALSGVMLPHVLNAARAAPIANQLRAAQHLAATGVKLPADAFRQTGKVSDLVGRMIRTGGYGQGASGAF